MAGEIVEIELPGGAVLELPAGLSRESMKAVGTAYTELTDLKAKREQAFKAATAAREQKRPGQTWLADANSPELEELDNEIAKRQDVIARVKAEGGTLLDKAGYYAKQGLSAVGRGLLQLPALVASAGMATDPQRYSRLNSGDPLKDAGRVGMRPTTTGEKYALGAVEGATAGVASPTAGLSPLVSAVSGGLSSVGSEAGAQVFGEGPLQRIGGGMLGGGLTALATLPKNTRAGLSREVLEGVSDADLLSAKALMEKAKAAGMPLNLSQAMPKGSNIDEMVAALSQNRHGKQTSALLHGQPGMAHTGLDMEISQLPGQSGSWQEAANTTQSALTGVMRDVKGARTALTSPLYDAAGDLGTSAPKQLGATIDRFVTSAGVSPKVAKEALALKQELLTNSITGKPRTNASDIKAAIDSFRSGIKRTESPLNPKEQGEMKYLVDRLVTQLGTKSIPIKAANTIYGQLSTNVVDPLKKSVVGRIAGPAGAQADKEAIASRVRSVFDSGTLPGSKTSDILVLEKSLRGAGQQKVFQDVAKTWLADKLSEASKQSGGRLAASTASTIERIFTGDPKSRQGLNDVLVGLARSKGLPDNALLPGIKNMLTYISAAARRPGPVAGTSPRELGQLSRSTTLSSVGNFSAIQPFRQLARRLNDSINSDAYGFMDKALNTPEGVDMLMKLGKQPVASPAAIQAFSTFLGTTAGTTSGQ